MLFTRADVLAGQEVFLSNGLMEYGSVFGHGTYLGPDFTAEYLHRAALSSIDFYGGPKSDKARTQTIDDFKANRYDKATGALVFTDARRALSCVSCLYRIRADAGLCRPSGRHRAAAGVCRAARA